jgi:hypothetical protein
MADAGKDKYKGLLTWAVEIVTLLFTAFGGFLTNIAPPSQTGTQFAVGIVSFVLLVVLLIVTAVGRQAPGALYRKRWIGAGVVCVVLFLPGAFFYWQSWERNTYGFPCNPSVARHVKATDQDLTDVAVKWIQSNPGQASACELELNLPSDQIWKPDAILAVSRRLLFLYTWLVVTLATALFSLVEANSPSAKK